MATLSKHPCPREINLEKDIILAKLKLTGKVRWGDPADFNAEGDGQAHRVSDTIEQGEPCPR